MNKPKHTELKEIYSWDEVPDFQSEAEEAEFWSTHSLGDEILAEMTPISEEILPPVKRQTPRLNQIIRYAVIFEKTDSNYSAHVPDLPGCVAVGNTLEDVKHNIQEVMASHLAALQAEGVTIPKPKTECDYVEVVSVGR